MKKITVFLLTIMFNILVFSQTSIDYNYEQVPIGGGGYITGMQVHKKNGDIRYYRTDVGGAYRYDPNTNSLEQIIHFGTNNLYSVSGIALHPTDENIVILAVGRNCDSSANAILVSNNKASTWQQIIVPGDYGANIYFAGNGGRNCGTNSDADRQGNCIALNPNNPNELFIGSRGTGLWKLDLTTHQFTHLGVGVVPDDVFPNSIRNIEFHPTQQNKLLIGYAGQGIYLGDTATNTYEKISTDTDLESVIDLSISKDGDYAMVACRDKGIYKCENFLSSSRVWTKVLDTDTANGGKGYLAVACSPHDNNTTVTIDSKWAAFSTFKKTTDAGSSWTTSAGKMKTNIYPYKTSGFGSNISEVAFHPTLKNTLFTTDWFSVYETTDWTLATILWSNANSRGHEEIVTSDLVAYPINSAGNFLTVGSADHSGFIYNDISEYNYPTHDIKSVTDDKTNIVKGAAYDYSYFNPDYLYAVTMLDWTSNEVQLLKSTDGGSSFTRMSNFMETEGKANIAVSATNGNNIVALNESGVYYSTDGGVTFNPSTNASTNNGTCATSSYITSKGTGNTGSGMATSSVFYSQKVLTADKVLGCVFYLYNRTNGNINVSTDGGETFFLVNNSSLPAMSLSSDQTRITSVPGMARNIWINFDSGLYYSDNGGVNFIKLTNVQAAYTIAIGKQISGESYPSVFLYGVANDGEEGIYRSTDKGVTWKKINNESEGELWGELRMLAADLNIEGRVYIGTSGKGVLYGDTTEETTLSTDNPIVENTEKAVQVYWDNENLSFSFLHESIYNIFMYDPSGRLIKQVKTNRVKQEQMDGSNLKKGVYFLNVYSDSGVKYSTKVIKK